MMFLITAAAIATVAPSAGTSPRVQATATIRVIRGVVVKLDGSSNPDAPSARDSLVKSADGSTQQLKLIEFQ
jgi:hypothetical protein